MSEPQICTCQVIMGGHTVRSSSCPFHGLARKSIVSTSDPSVPLSAIRALVQQIEKVAQEMQEAGEGGLNDYYAAADCSLMVEWSKELRANLAQLTALCPAPPEDRK